MRNIRLKIVYKGTNYCGWQVQKSPQSTVHSPRSIQGTIETALRKILQEKISLIGSGRTDAGVHALGQVANFKTHSRLSSENILRALNSELPADIKILESLEADLKFNAQHSAKSKVYSYLILNSKISDPFLSDFACHVSFPLDIELMSKEALFLKGKHDFKSFCASGSNIKETTRTINKIEVKLEDKSLLLGLPTSGRLVIITIEADGFLYNMVRNIAGTLIDIARGFLNKGDMKRILEVKDRRLAGVTAPAEGLYLREVKYEKN